ncbi:MAG TPA: response regulator transcription factor [Chitinophagales bacterium]|nr:response regulator transcription factor [Chitinophagales bacterium]HMW12223.1 response regulator transcription factor [Chitinophagales bacterium]HMX59888.1 response regulator transcription factor [Chitinophagales bacterium]HMY23538.1 response regulator transcription factor [Chitinophagales bacterium]HMZ33196.1 response regulator transcription factor [Chitinophagales bacterium]
MSFRIAVTEDNAINRNTFMQKVQQMHDVKMVFIAENGNECLAELKGLPHNILPQVIFMDLEMPVMNGIETIQIAKALYPNIHFIVLTVFDDDDKIFEAIKAGASGYLLKHEPANILQEALINVIETGGAPMSPAIARKTLKLLSNTTNSISVNTENAFPNFITEREKEILKHTINGWDAKRISMEINVSVLTVRKHIANIYEKLHVSSKAQIITLAHKNKWI